MKSKASTRHPRWATIALLFLLVLAMVLPANAALRVQRPITYDGGRINQSYLWGEIWGTDIHRGVDFSYGLGTDVYAVGDGTVVALREDYSSGEGTGFGNYVLIRHSGRHWDRTTQQWAYVYSIYAHLQRDSVSVSAGAAVTAGQWIAEVDNTGNSSGNHLHLQICIHPQSDRTIANLSSSTTSRNPELWLQPFNYGGTNTGPVIGRVSDSNGNPVGNLRIYGLSKPLGSGSTTYVWSETYHDAWANPDDILLENWGTTDVYPGTYHLQAKYTDGTLYRDLGSHTVEAGKTTYVGLYPVYLPDVGDSGNWTASIAVQNTSETDTAEVVTTYFWSSGSVYAQTTDYLAPRAGITLDPPGDSLSGSAIVVASQDVSVVVEKMDSSTGSDYAYNGVAGGNAVNSDWGQASTTTRLPLLMDNNSGWSTSVTIFNPGSGSATYDLDYYAQNGGGPYQGPQGSLAPYASATFNQYGSACPTIGAGRVTSNQPLAAIVREYNGNVSTAYNGFRSGATTLNPPLIMANNSGWSTGIAVQNLGSGATDITVTYYPSPGFSSRNPETAYGVQPNATAIFIQGGGQWGSERWIGSARITASRDLAAIVNETASGKASTYDCSADGSGRIGLPLVRNDAYDWISGVQVQNLDGASANVVLRIGDTQTWSGWIDGYKSLTFFPVPGTSPGYEGTVTVQCTNGRRIAAVVNTHMDGGSGDRIRTYNGINHR